MTSGSDTNWERWGASSTVETPPARAGLLLTIPESGRGVAYQTAVDLSMIPGIAMHRFGTNSSCALARHITWRTQRDKRFPQSDHYATADFSNSRDKDRQP